MMKITDGIKNAVIETLLRKGIDMDLDDFETMITIPDEAAGKPSTTVVIKAKAISVRLNKGEKTNEKVNYTVRKGTE